MRLLPPLLLLACTPLPERIKNDSGTTAYGAGTGSDADADADADADTDTDTDTDTPGFTDVGPAATWFVTASSEADYALYGESGSDRFGHVGTAGDLDGDGLADMTASRRGVPPAAAGDTWVSVVYGSTNWTAPATATFRFAEGDLPGAMAGVGDLTGDGVDDLAVCTAGSDVLDADAGTAWILPGGRRWGGETEASATAVARVHGDPGQQVCASVVRSNDLTGDGMADLLIGGTYGSGGSTSGAVWVFAGPVAGDLHTATAAITLSGGEDGDLAGSALAVGDVNGDGQRDLAVGAIGGGPLSGSGAVEIVLGPLSNGSLASADYSITGIDPQDYLGAAQTVHIADVDGDGRHDLIAGASGDEENELNPNHGTVYVVYGEDLYPAPASAVARTRFFGLRPDQAAGTAVQVADLDADGDAEILFGAPDEIGFTSGAVYLFDDPGLGRYSAGEAEGLIVGRAFADRFGASLAVPGDVDGDRDLDLWVGALDADPPLGGNVDAGAAFLFRSRVAL